MVQFEGAAIKIERPERKPLPPLRGGGGKGLKHGQILPLKPQQMRPRGLVAVVAGIKGSTESITGPIARYILHAAVVRS